MPTTPTGQFSKTLYNLESLLVASTSFRNEIANGTTEAAARDRVYWPGSTLPDTVLRPLALIRLSEGQSLTFNHSGAGGGYPSFPLFILLERAAVAGDSAKERQLKFLNWVGAVVSEMNTVARTAGYLEVSEFVLAGWMIAGKEENAVYDQAEIELKVFG